MKTYIIFSIFFLLFGRDAHHIIVWCSSGDICCCQTKRAVDRLSSNLKVKQKTRNVEYNLIYAGTFVKLAHPFQEVTPRKVLAIRRHITISENITEPRHCCLP
jgi:hypothetical protein